jgi:hypothetical protein
MSNENAEVKSFFAGYETANAVFDVEQIAACYADVFLFGGPESVQCVKKEDFLKLLPRHAKNSFGREDWCRPTSPLSKYLHWTRSTPW